VKEEGNTKTRGWPPVERGERKGGDIPNNTGSAKGQIRQTLGSSGVGRGDLGRRGVVKQFLPSEKGTQLALTCRNGKVWVSGPCRDGN